MTDDIIYDDLIERMKKLNADNSVLNMLRAELGELWNEDHVSSPRTIDAIFKDNNEQEK